MTTPRFSGRFAPTEFDQVPLGDPNLPKSDDHESDDDDEHDEDDTESFSDINPVAKRRHCTDFSLLIIFACCCFTELVFQSYAFDHGSPKEMLGARDKNGDLCGEDGRGSHLFIPITLDMLENADYPADLLDTGICVDECPKVLDPEVTYDLVNADSYRYIEDYTMDVICDYGVSYTNALVEDLGRPLVADGVMDENIKCWLPYSTRNVFGRCVPYDEDEGYTVVYYDPTSTESDPENMAWPYPDELEEMREKTDSIHQWMDELSEKWDVFFWVAITALSCGFCYAVFMRHFAHAMVWLMVLIAPVAMLMMTIFCWSKVTSSEEDSANREMFTLFGFASTVGLIGFALLMFFMVKRINVAAKVIGMASGAVVALPSMILVPIGAMIVVGFFFAWWIATAVYMVSCGEYDKDTMEWKNNEDMKNALWFHLFFLLWTVAFVNSVVQLILATSVSIWYFCRDGPDFPRMPVWFSVKLVLKYHLGTAAFGGLVLAIAQMIRAVFNYLMARIEQHADNQIIKFIHYCIDCCLRCFERLIKFINENAFVQTAIYGTSFCPSIKNAVKLLLDNVARAAAVEYAGSFILLVGKLVITAFSTAVGLYCLAGGKVNTDEGTNPLAVVLYVIISWSISSLFMIVYEMSMDTVFQCYCIDDNKAPQDTKQCFEDAQDATSKAIDEGAIPRSRASMKLAAPVNPDPEVPSL
eukprot:TRINITY_DN4132_c0_g1::TRINITY_DN4132_c0_g1_i1::g.2131::m.2131 TRINITY_DN4132_c0_g1::TRINITY_DN4132_c0_g1_i1::g.2131  ORF type:complete len:698 (-),score=148.49,sp/Q54I48/CTL2_DICDI/27.29/5e-58,Choline_transpo/PF04515.7/3e+03,Choline_transpo/PF04515.7/1.5e-82,PBP1_TM/PF14812.1/0.95,PBP1_TM/PF14812.1/9.3e+03,PBP1_TM/PF14812.1/1.1e+03 TRINITY_DN4132_c0_g1_i1:1237-3330(-)